MAQDQELQAISYNIQVLKEQAEYLNEQLDYISESLRGLRITLSTINGLEDLPANHEIMVPIGNGAFLNANVKDSSKILIAIAKDILMEKTLPDARAFTQKLIDAHKNNQQKINEQRGQVLKRLEEFQNLLEQKVGTGSGELPPEDDSQ